MAKALLDKLLREFSEEERELRKSIEPTPDEEEAREIYIALSEDLRDPSISQKEKTEAEEALSQIKGYTFFAIVAKPSLTVLNHYCEKHSFFDCQEFLDKAGDIATVEEAYDVLIRLHEEQRKQVLIYANNYCTLDKAVTEQDKSLFIKSCYDTTQGMPEILKICGFLKTAFELKDLPQQLDDCSELSKEDYDTIETEYIEPRLDSITNACDAEKDVLPSLRIPEEGEEAFSLEYAENVFCSVLDCYLDPKQSFTKAESKVMEEIITSHPEFDDVIWPIYYEVLNQYDRNLCNHIAQMTESKGEECIEVQRAKSYLMEHPAQSGEQVTNTSGRKQGCWLKGKSKSDENSWAIKIKTKVWDKALEQARSLDYGKLTEFQARKTYFCMSAALIYKAAEIIGIAERWGDGIQSSFERTMNFTKEYAKIDRRYMPKYLELLDYYLMAKEFQVRGNQELFNRYEYNENFHEEDESEYAVSTYTIHSKHIFPSNNEINQLNKMRNELLCEYEEKNKPMYDFLLKNFKSIGTALSIVKQTIKKIR